MTNLDRRAVVFEKHTLGIIYQIDQEFFQLQILKASIVRGSPYRDGFLTLSSSSLDNIVLATKKDFNEFNVSWHSDYLINPHTV